VSSAVNPDGAGDEAGESREASTSSALADDTGDDDFSLIHVVQLTIAPTSRSTLDLLSLPFPFSQVDLLPPADFVKAAARRRVRMWGGRELDESGLRELHRTRILVPFFCVSIADEPTGDVIDISDSLTPQHIHGTHVVELYRAAAEGRLTDPAAELFTPWPTESVRTLWPSVERGYLYSHHQLLALEHARSLVGSLRPRFLPDHRREWFLSDKDLPNEQARVGLESRRALAVTLSALDTRSWPHVTNLVQNADVWRATNIAQIPEDLAAWLALSVDQLRQQSQRLRANASFGDVLGEFYDVVRRAKSTTWESLRGDARCAMDERMAAEVLDHFADELDGVRTAERPGTAESLLQQGLSRRPESLDGMLTNLHLSPHPPLVVALEGKTEMKLFRRVMEQLGVTLDPTWMKLVDFEGTLNLSLLARFAAEPLLGADRGDYVMLDRPVTRFLVLTDAENKFDTPPHRAAQRRLLLDSITKGVPADLRRDLYTRKARIVEILTWGKYPFEFAHFTDRQIADGLLALTGVPYPTGKADLIAKVTTVRATSRNVENVWPTSGIRNLKVSFADELWPILERRIENAITKRTQGPPIMRAALRAYELAMESYRLKMSVRRYRF
jgi:hypothetical protein